MGRVRAFVMTDIVGSTTRWSADFEAMTVALALHDDVLQSVVESRGGAVFKHTGDGLIAAFDTADDAMDAATAASPALEDTDWGDAEPLSVRVSVHVGTTVERNGDHFGPVINCLARVNDLGHAGQVLVTDVARQLATTPRGHDLGEIELRGIAEPLRVWQFDEGTHPPLRVRSVTRNSLPSMPTQFLGRTAEIAELRRLLADHRLVTIVGVGGCGKTRLAVEVAAGVQAEFPGGLWFADLTPETTEAGVAAAVARSMRIEDQVGAAGLVAACSAAFDAPTLLVLDNCEHVIDAAARLADELVAADGRISVLTTTREALAVPGERIWQIPSLGEEAPTLFVERAAAAGVAIEDEHLADVATLCDQIDRIPLAIELAAGQLRSLPLAELSQRLTEGFAVLDGGRGQRRRRHQTLAAMIDWSYDLLGPDERNLLAELSVFAGTFSANGVRVVSTLADPTGPLRALVEQSLVALDPSTGRYRLLETIRFYGLELLARSGRLEAMRDRHLEWALDLGALTREPELPSRQLRARDVEQRTEAHHILDALTWADGRGRRADVADLFGGSLGMLIDVDPSAARAWFQRCPPPTTDVGRVLRVMYEVTCAYALAEPYGHIGSIDEAASILWTLPDETLVRHGEGLAYVLLFQANRSGIIGDTDRELEQVAAMGELTARLPQLTDVEWARWQCATDAYRRINDPRAVATMERALAAGLECRLSGHETARMFAAPTFFQFGEHERAVEFGLPCLHERTGTATFRLNQVAPVAGSLARLGRPADALDVVDLDHGPLTALVQQKLRSQRARALAYILSSLDDDDLVPELVGSSLAHEDRVSSAGIRHEAAPFVGGIDRLDDLIDAAEPLPESAHERLVGAGYERAVALIRS